jgi:hypothetical protein
VRLIWSALALLFAFLAVGGVVHAFSRQGSTLFDLVISALFAWAAIGIWRRNRA